MPATLAEYGQQQEALGSEVKFNSNLKDFFNSDITKPAEKQKVGPKKFLTYVRKVGNPNIEGAWRIDSSAWTFARFKLINVVNIPGAYIVQGVKTTITYYEGTVVDPTKEKAKSITYLLEGFGLEASNTTKLIDGHLFGNLPMGPSAQEPYGSSQLIVATMEFEAWYGTYDGKAVDQRGFTEFVKAATEKYDATKITSALKFNYMLTFTVNINGAWTLKHPAFGIDSSGTWENTAGT